MLCGNLSVIIFPKVERSDAVDTEEDVDASIFGCRPYRYGQAPQGVADTKAVSLIAEVAVRAHLPHVVARTVFDRWQRIRDRTVRGFIAGGRHLQVQRFVGTLEVVDETACSLVQFPSNLVRRRFNTISVFPDTSE